MKILINCLGIQDSGGITVLEKLFNEIQNSDYTFLIVCNQNNNISTLFQNYKYIKNFEFLIFPKKSFFYRLYIENIIFRKIIKSRKINLVYNFSGSAQFLLNILQLTKIHNLLFYSKKIDQVYFSKKKYISWIKSIFLKRIIFHTMIKQTKALDVQSKHVKEYMNDFLDISKKQFFIKSDVDIRSKLFKKIKKYDFTKKIRILFIVGPHFESLHKNLDDFIKAMKVLQKLNISFEIVITLTQEELEKSASWDKSLNENTIFIGYVSKSELQHQFQDNTILISTSVIETLGLHVIEAIQNGVLTIVPNEKYCIDVYGKNVLKYELFDKNSLANQIKNIILLDDNEIEDIILKNQRYLIKNESQKSESILNIFDKLLKETDV